MIIKKLLGVQDRYFFISYVYNKGFGNCSVKTTGGIYPSIDNIKKHVNEPGFLLINILELSSKDSSYLYNNDSSKM